MRDLNFNSHDGCLRQQVDHGLKPDELVRCATNVILEDRKVSLGLRAHILDQPGSFMTVYQGLYGLLQADGDE